MDRSPTLGFGAVCYALFVEEFFIGAVRVRLVLGGPLSVVGALANITNFCTPSWMYSKVAARRSPEEVSHVQC